MLHLLNEPGTWAAFATLTLLEIVLGIDNIIFLAILVGRLPARRQKRARVVGLGLAMIGWRKPRAPSRSQSMVISGQWTWSTARAAVTFFTAIQTLYLEGMRLRARGASSPPHRRRRP